MSNNDHTRWDTLWKTHRISGRITRYNMLSFDEIKRFINLAGLNTIEVGCGTGQLSLLFSQEAKRVTLLDYTESSLKQAKKLFEKHGINKCSFVRDDLFDIHHNNKYDLVVSSGLLEHFKGEEELACLNAHKYLAKKNGYVVIIAPSDTWFNEKRCRDPDNIRRYGYWRPIREEKMLQLFKETELTPVIIKKFDVFYGLKPNILVNIASRFFYKTNIYPCPVKIDEFFGGLIIGIAKNL